MRHNDCGGQKMAGELRKRKGWWYFVTRQPVQPDVKWGFRNTALGHLKETRRWRGREWKEVEAIEKLHFVFLPFWRPIYCLGQPCQQTVVRSGSPQILVFHPGSNWKCWDWEGNLGPYAGQAHVRTTQLLTFPHICFLSLPSHSYSNHILSMKPLTLTLRLIWTWKEAKANGFVHIQPSLCFSLLFLLAVVVSAIINIYLLRF